MSNFLGIIQIEGYHGLGLLSLNALNLAREFGKDADGNDLPKTVISKEFGGRLRENKYYDMDAIIAAALEMCEQELQ